MLDRPHNIPNPLNQCRKSNIWTSEKVDTLTAEWARGYSASKIAAHMGSGLTRNAVLGKVHRLGLPARMPQWSPEERAARRAAWGALGRALRAGNVKFFRRSTPFMCRKVGPAPTPAEAPIPRNLSILELDLHECRWPVTDGDPHAFCGHPVVDGQSYCPYHFKKSMR